MNRNQDDTPMNIAEHYAVSDGKLTKYFKGRTPANAYAYSLWENMSFADPDRPNEHTDLVKDILTTVYAGKVYLMTEIQFEPNKSEIKARALAKLTQEEKEILGLC